MNGCHRFYLHVGVHKTGTTALQKFFEDNDKQLSASDLYRVKTGLSADVGLDWGHHPLARALIKRGDEADLLWQSGAHEVTGRRNILVSSEVFSFIRRHSLYLPLRRALPGFLVRPKCYLRRQDQMLESIYNHNVKALGETDSIMEFAKRRMGRLDHTTLLACLSKSFGKEAIIVRIYDPKQLRGDIFEDFLSALGVSCDAKFVRPLLTLNPGLTPTGLGKMLDANRKYVGNADELRRIREAIVRDHPAKARTDHSLLSPGERADNIQHFHGKNNEIAQAYFGREWLF